MFAIPVRWGFALAVLAVVSCFSGIPSVLQDASKRGPVYLGLGSISDTHTLSWDPWPYLITRRNNYELDPMRETGGEMCE